MAVFTIRKMTRADWPEVSRVYAEGIATGFATFETEVPDYDSWNKSHLPSCRFVAVEGESLLGWSALSPVSGRCVYGGVSEVSVYTSENARAMGVGYALMEILITASESEGMWTLQSGIFPQNKGSIRLHEKLGFRLVGYRERIGKLNGVWHDNLIYERRSPKVGKD